MSSQEKRVSLTLDEMAIQASLDFDIRSGSVLGMATIPDSTGEEYEGLATHALVFMLRGLSTPWKQPVAYEFTASSWSSAVVKEMIHNIIQEAHNIGLFVESVTMDMGGGNQGILREFGISCTEKGPIQNSVSHPQSENANLFFFPDVPHLLKNLRNHLTRGQKIHLSCHTVTKYNLPTDIVDLKFVKELVEIDEAHNLKLVPGLNKSYLDLDNFEKMKVLPAKIVLSRGTAAALRVLVDQNKISKEALTTAWFCEQVSQWYDLMTSRSANLALSKFSDYKHKTAINFLSDFIHVIRLMKIGEEQMSKNGKAKKVPFKPVQRGILISTQSAMEVSSKLIDEIGFLYVMMAAFSQDGLENLFSIVRSKNPIPTALEFKNGLRIICLSQLLKSKVRGSYEIDPYFELPKGEIEADLSMSMSSDILDLEDRDLINEFNEDMDEEDFDDLNTASTSAPTELTEIEKMSLYHLAGYCIKNLLKLNKTCNICIEALKTKDKLPISIFTNEKCYAEDSLIFASEAVYQLCDIAEKIIIQYSDKLIKLPSVLLFLVNKAENCSTDIMLPICHNVKTNLLKYYCRVRLFTFIKQKKAFLKEKQKQEIKNESSSSRSIAMRQKIKNS